jgi:hypothetical protein
MGHLQQDHDIRAEIARRCAAESDFQQWLRAPEQELLSELDLDVVSPTLEDLYPVFLAGAAFQHLDDVFAGPQINSDAARQSCERWITSGKHASILRPPQSSANFEQPEPGYEPGSAREFLEHELFAIFRAGTRYAATGEALRVATAWSVPPESPAIDFAQEDAGTGDVWLRNPADGNIAFVPAASRTTLRWSNATVGFLGTGGGFEILAHYSEGIGPNDGEIACGYSPVSSFEGMQHITRDTALAVHPVFEAYLTSLGESADDSHPAKAPTEPEC